MICKKCGFEIQEECEFCPACGEKLADSESAQVETESTEAEITEAVPEAEVFENTEAEIAAEAEADEYGAEEAEENYYAENEDASDAEETAEELFETAVATATKSKNPFIKIIAAVIAIILVLGVGTAGYYEIFRPNEANPVLGLFGVETAGESNPFIYSKNENGSTNIYYSDNGTEKLMSTLGESQTSFSVYSDFVSGGKNVFYVIENKLYCINNSSSEPTLIDEGVLPNTTVIAADDKTILYVKKDDSDNNVLYKYTLGGKTKVVETLGLIKADDYYPLYGFADTTKKAWYIKKDKEAIVGEMFLEGNSVATDVFRAFYCSANGKDVVYTTRSDETDRLLLKEKGGDAKEIASIYSEQQARPIFVTKPSKGFYHLGDVTESENGLSGTLYFRPFGKDAVAVDTNIVAYLLMTENNSTGNPYYDSGAVLSSSSNLLYQRSDYTVLFSKNASYGTMPNGCVYRENTPSFSNDASALAFIDKNDKTLKYSKYTKKGWSEPVVIAENAEYVHLNNDGSMAAYISSSANDSTEGEAAAETQYTLHLYDVEKQSTETVSENASGMQYFSGAGNKTLYFTENLDMATYSAQLSKFENSAASVIDSAVTEFATISGDRVVALKVNADSQRAVDLYIVQNGTLSPIGTNISGLMLY